MTAQRIAELEAEVMRLREALEKSRGALAYCKGIGRDNPNLMESTCWHGLAAVDKALSTPFTPTALNELIEKVEKRTIERCAVVAEELRHPDGFSGENVDWCAGTDHAAAAIRKLGEQ